MPDESPRNRAVRPVTPDVKDPRALFGALSRGVDLQGPIAAVGRNTDSPDGHAYVLGFGLAAQVLLRALTSRQTGSDPDLFVSEDALIYPIAFCARHFAELFLKEAPQAIHGLRGGSFKSPDHHDIERLWPDFEQACSLDRRLQHFPELLREPILAIARLDPSGQTFRYRRSSEDKLHLNDLAVIYVPQFERAFTRLLDTVKEFDSLTDGLRWEYELGTFTENLSRFDLEKIAERIGVAAATGKEALRREQRSICSEFGLSNRQYELARTKIQQDYRLSRLAGVEKPIAAIASETIAILIFSLTEADVANLLMESEVAATWGVLAAGGNPGVAEDFEPEVARFLDRTSPTSRADVIRRFRRHPTRFVRGLRRLGQSSLLAALEELFPLAELEAYEEVHTLTTAQASAEDAKALKEFLMGNSFPG